MSNRNYKRLQLCKQIQRTIDYVLMDSSDPVLGDLYCESVIPNGTSVIVTVYTMNDKLSMLDIIPALDKAKGYIRSEVAGDISRKKVPELLFKLR